ncbi:MAG: hypothetical protein NPIRA06_33760 [Nitrospirales bacterium]|nr:MAG: hypothetical protein NPIRA06_33760 [Nitrospirales bacterium]
MFAQRSTIASLGAAATLAMCLALPGLIWAKTGPSESKPGQPVNEILRHIDILNDKMPASSEPGGIGRCGGSKMDGQTFSGPDRFVPVLYGVAYCDRETGIVWETSPEVRFFNWAGAISHCTTREVGGRKGWALPMREQLASLLDINSVLCLGGGLCLPDVHPFQNVKSANYWSVSTTGGTPTFAWLVNYFLGGVFVLKLEGKGLAWCVRDGQSSDGQGLAAIVEPHHDHEVLEGMW